MCSSWSALTWTQAKPCINDQRIHWFKSPFLIIIIIIILMRELWTNSSKWRVWDARLYEAICVCVYSHRPEESTHTHSLSSVNQPLTAAGQSWCRLLTFNTSLHVCWSSKHWQKPVNHQKEALYENWTPVQVNRTH